jgi:hypothetical protein
MFYMDFGSGGASPSKPPRQISAVFGVYDQDCFGELACSGRSISEEFESARRARCALPVVADLKIWMRIERARLQRTPKPLAPWTTCSTLRCVLECFFNYPNEVSGQRCGLFGSVPIGTEFLRRSRDGLRPTFVIESDRLMGKFCQRRL